MGVCEENKFKTIFDHWCQPLQKFAQSRGLTKGDAADLVQDAFVRLWKNCHKTVESKVKSYLFTITNNLIIDNYRKNKIRFVVKEDYHEIKSKIDPHYLLEVDEFKSKMESVLNEMPEHQREVFLLHRMNGMSYKEVAAHLGLGVKAIEKRMQKALIHLYNAKILKKR